MLPITYEYTRIFGFCTAQYVLVLNKVLYYIVLYIINKILAVTWAFDSVSFFAGTTEFQLKRPDYC